MTIFERRRDKTRRGTSSSTRAYIVWKRFVRRRRAQINKERARERDRGTHIDRRTKEREKKKKLKRNDGGLWIYCTHTHIYCIRIHMAAAAVVSARRRVPPVFLSGVYRTVRTITAAVDRLRACVRSCVRTYV